MGMQEWLDQIEQAKAAVRDAARPEAVAKQHALGKLSARERIARLVDAGSFTEFGILTRSRADVEALAGAETPADGVVTGVARLDGRPVAVSAQDFSVFGGSDGEIGAEKNARLSELAMRNGYPYVMLLDGGGHRIQEGLDSHHFARAMGHAFLTNAATASGWIPIVAVMMGPGFAGPSNYSALSDFVVAVRGTSTMGIAGPALVKAATGEDLTKEELGGSKLHAEVTGMADLEAEDDEHALRLVRQFLGYLPSNAGELPPVQASDDPPDRRDEALLTVVPESRKRAYDMRQVVALVADQGSLFELKPRFARNAVTALARLGGRPVGFVGNQPLVMGGTLDTPACDKIAHFVSLCDAFGLPLVYLVDVPGFLPGRTSERTGLIRHSGKLLFEAAQASVPKLTVVIRKAYGLAYYAMCGGRGLHGSLCLAWPSAEFAAVGLEGGVDVIYRREIAQAPDPAAKRQELIDHFTALIGARRGAEWFGVDDVIDPRDTRRFLIETLSALRPRQDVWRPPKRHGIVPI